ncbi:MAG: hypothetical protein WD939_10425 [Dehalococcoidia bacterium]
MPPRRHIALLAIAVGAMLGVAVSCGGDAEEDPLRDAAIIAAMPVTRLSQDDVLTLDAAATTYGEALQGLRDDGFRDVSVVTINEEPVAQEPASAAPVWVVELAGADPELGCGAYAVLVDEDGRAFVWARQAGRCPDAGGLDGRDRALLAAGTRFVIPGPAVQAVVLVKSRFLEATQLLDTLGFELQEVSAVEREDETPVWLVTFESASPDVDLTDTAPTPEPIEFAPCEEVAQVIDDELSVVIVEARREIEGCR